MRLNIGAHVSIAGGVAKAVERGRDAGCDCIQIFTKSNVQWRAKPLSDAEAAEFRACARRLDVRPAAAHASYLLNLGTPDEALWQRSVEALVDEVGRAEKLGLPALVLHPGAHVGAGAAAGVKRVAAALRETLRRTRDAKAMILLETTAGAGTTLGGSFAELAAMIRGCRSHRRLGVCLDTAHVYAAGYDLADAAAYERAFAELDRLIGLDRLRAVHLNDTRVKLGGRRDRHEHIGRGRLGRAAFCRIMRDARLLPLPKLLETPKSGEGRCDWDEASLRLLRRLATPY